MQLSYKVGSALDFTSYAQPSRFTGVVLLIVLELQSVKFNHTPSLTSH